MEPTRPGAGVSLVALRCERCGGSFDVRALEAIAVCPYCLHQQQLPAELMAQVASYAIDIDMERARARFHSLVAERHAALRPTAWLGLVVWGVSVALTIGALSFAFLGHAGGMTVGGALAAMGILAVFASSATLTAVRNRWSAREGAATSFESTCPSCGGTNVLAIGQTLATCTYCGAALVPGERVRAIGLGLAEALTRASKLDAVASSRRFRLTAARRDRMFRTLGALVTPLLPAVIAVYSYQEYQLDRGELSQAVFATCLTLLLVAAPFFASLIRRLVERPIRQSITAIASGPGSTRLADVEGTICWLNGYWPDELGEYYDLQAGPGFHAVATTNRGFPVLVVTRAGRFLHIVVAATVEVSRVSHELLTSFGFRVEVCESGVVASLRGKPLTRFGDPRRDQRLRRCIDATVEAVISRGGRPAARC
jgi:ribosomal protein L37AE/L43A